MNQQGQGAKSVVQFCDDYNISRSTFYKLVRDGLVKLSRIYGKAVVFAADEAVFVATHRAGEFTPAEKVHKMGEGRDREHRARAG
jgi:hypothetical protein